MNGLHWPDARGWIGIGTFALTVMVLWMLAAFPGLRQDEFFKTIATLIIGTGFINGVVSWAYSATKGGGEQAASSARIAERVAGLAPVGEPAPKDAGEAAQQTADAASEKADEIQAARP